MKLRPRGALRVAGAARPSSGSSPARRNDGGTVQRSAATRQELTTSRCSNCEWAVHTRTFCFA